METQITTGPIVQDDGNDPTGSRLTLDFQRPIPALTGAQVKALLAPLISFDVKTPVQAFTDTLPPKLKDAILNHKVMVGMSTDMVLFAKGTPQSKSREMDGQMPFEEWIYGKPPEEVDFVRINGNRVIRVEIAKMGESPVIFTEDVVSGMMRTDGTPCQTAANHTHITKEGDVERDPNKEAPDAPPSLRAPGEQLPSDEANGANSGSQKNEGVMRPVQAPVKKPEYQPDANPDSVPGTTPAAATDARRAYANNRSPPALRLPNSTCRGANGPIVASARIHVNWIKRVPLLPAQFHCDLRQPMTAPLKPFAQADVCRDTP